ncbi:hypothetical protein E1258_23460 [Micromonospora sp. KC207]|uniref:hypothetical protein n=1 Tax=Micromonospora sp. KC207 TaxID=2530377 RepID=UPI00104A3C7F|nr:hypothetical protein [Micromonospora sp. KC207]TDC54789.1 hypothetical protein E1258_23460 [Micromonospora sp. KC207]
MADEIDPMPFKAWRRERPTAPPGGGRPAMCGGPDYTAAERLELVRERQRAMDEAARREREEAEAREAAGRRHTKQFDEEDGYLAAERPRRDRYAVNLLRQDDSAWGGGGAGSGVLG